MLAFTLPTTIHPQKNHIPRLPAGGDSLFIAKLAQQQRPLLVVVDDAYQLQRIEQELACFATNLRYSVLADYEVLPYERQSPYRELIAERLRCLWQVVHKQIDILLVQASTLQCLLPPTTYFYQRVLKLARGEKLDSANLARQLVNAGYEHVSQVYEAGEFAIRGSIIDVFPMGATTAIRVDLFDDEIEEIWRLDHKQQQVGEALTHIEMLPTREYPHDTKSVAQMLAKFQVYFPKHNDENIVKDLKNNLLPAGVEFYLPLFFEKCASLFDYLDDSWQVVLSNSLVTTLNLNWQEISKRYEYYQWQYPCVKPSDLFLTSEQVFAGLKAYRQWQVATSGDYYPRFKNVPDLAVNDKLANPFASLQHEAKLNQVIVCAPSLGRLEILRQTMHRFGILAPIIEESEQIQHAGLYLYHAPLYQGFYYANTLWVTEAELYPGARANRSSRVKRQPALTTNPDLIVRDLAEIKVGDLVVHINHGIGRYNGLTLQNIAEQDYEMLELEYQNGSKLFIPVHNLHLISRYSQIEGAQVELTRLGSKHWANVKAKAEQKVNDIAAELLELYAKRELEQGTSFQLPAEYASFAQSFGYQPTQDQQNCFDEIIKDLTAAKPMDRLICGDVGFGKTEVAMRAAFICAMNGYQVAILAPTTLLTEQLYQNLVNRLAGWPLTIGQISRFRSRKEINQSLAMLASGQLDIIVGTHRLLQDDIKFAKLGLVIIDEEHRFGVKQKEKLKQLRSNIDILTMTATPIPRTLSMALDGVRDFSIIATAPSRRLAVNTQIVAVEDKALMQEAILREIRRGGQVFFLYNDVATIEQMYHQLIELLPELRIAIAHGQLPEHELEVTIRDFIQQRYNLLLCSTIIETGIDIPNANTILIYRADKFGLAQLHQLRGRVGRSYHQAYCYLLVPEKITSDASKRLEAITATSALGAGFNLAMHDLEIRGAGEILGENQAGNIKEVGLSLYTEMLRQAIKKLKHGGVINLSDSNLHCEVNLNVNALLPTSYCPNVQERLIYYKRLAKAETNAELDIIYQEIIDNYGLPPCEVSNLIQMHELRLRVTTLGVKKLDASQNAISLTFIEQPPLDPLQIVLAMQELRTCKYDGNSKLIWQVKSSDLAAKVSNINKLIDLISGKPVSR